METPSSLTPPTTPTDPPPHSSRRTGGAGLGGSAIILSLIALAVSGYVWYGIASVSRENTQLLEQVGTILADIEERLDEYSILQDDVDDQTSLLDYQLENTQQDIDEQIEELHNRVVEQHETTETQQEELEQYVQILSDSLTKLRARSSANSSHSVDDWYLIEVEQLMVIANQRLQLSGDVELTIAALKLADSNLQQLADPKFAVVRRILIGEIAALRKVSAVDVAATVDRLSEIADELEELPWRRPSSFFVKEEIEESDDEDTETDVDADDEDYADDDADTETETETKADRKSVSKRDSSDSFFASLFADLIAMIEVEIDHTNPSSDPDDSDSATSTSASTSTSATAFSTDEQRATVSRIKLVLELAKLAFLKKQEEVYIAQLDEAQKLVTTNFDQDSDEVEDWLQELSELVEIAPQAKLPDISNSLQTLRAAIIGGN